MRRLFLDFVSACWEVIKLPFWLIGQGFRRLFGLGGRKLLLLVGAAVIVTVVALTLFVKATSQPGFCVTCHYMRPYFDSWRTSTHHDVECTKCHIPPGLEGTVKHKFMAVSMVVNYATGLYKRSKPWAEIDDASCLRGGCHETRLLASVEDFQGVRFDHRPHLIEPRRDRELRCTSCHAQIVQGEHITVTEGTCFLCHFKPDAAGEMTDLARCTHCHNPPHGASAEGKPFDHGDVLARGVDCLSCHATAVSGDGYVPPDRCNSCHAQKAHIERYDDLEFVHQKHVTENKVECLQCHIAIRHGRETKEEEHPDLACAVCHGGETGPILSVWNGTLPGLPATPSAMARIGMTCTSCHVEPIHKPDGGFGRPQCSPCHEDRYDALWRNWKSPLLRAVADLEREAVRLPEDRRAPLLAALRTYRRGNPVHNPDLLAELTRAVRGVERRAEGNCFACHPAAGELAPVWNGKAVEHRVHARAGLDCQTCHETDEPRHGRLKVSAEQCNACHHRTITAATDCAACHAFQVNVYHGKLGASSSPSAMAEAEISCSDCHAPDGKTIQRPDEAACVACHDESYADTLRVWRHEGVMLLSIVEQEMRALNPSGERYKQFAELADALKRDRSQTVHHPELFRDWIKRIRTTP